MFPRERPKNPKASQIANDILDLAAIYLAPIAHKARTEGVLTPQDWRVAYDVCGVVKVMANYAAEDDSQDITNLSEEELLNLRKELLSKQGEEEEATDDE